MWGAAANAIPRSTQRPAVRYDGRDAVGCRRIGPAICRSAAAVESSTSTAVDKAETWHLCIYHSLIILIASRVPFARESNYRVSLIWGKTRGKKSRRQASIASSAVDPASWLDYSVGMPRGSLRRVVASIALLASKLCLSLLLPSLLPEKLFSKQICCTSTIEQFRYRTTMQKRLSEPECWDAIGIAAEAACFAVSRPSGAEKKVTGTAARAERSSFAPSWYLGWVAGGFISSAQ